MTMSTDVLPEQRSIPTSSDTDQDLVVGLRAGDHDAYREAAKRYSAQMLGTARRIVGPNHAEDIVQDAWVSVLTSIDGFEGRAALGTWLVRITTNKAISHLRSSSREARLDAQQTDRHAGDWFDERGRWAKAPALGDASSPAELLSADALQACIDKHLSRMPVRQRAVVVMRDMQQRTIDEICNELGLSPSNGRVLLHRGRLRLLNMINGYQMTGTC